MGLNAPLIHYDPESDTLHLELATRPESKSIVHYIDHPHAALLVDEKTGQSVGFHVENMSGFILSNVNDLEQRLKPDELVAVCFARLLEALSRAKPNDKSQLDRRYAITITQTELAQSHFAYYVLGGDDG